MKSTDFGVTFSPEFVVGDVLDNLQVPPAYWAPSGDRYNPMYERSYSMGSSFPSLGVDRSNGPRRGTLYAAWAEHADGPIPAASALSGETPANDSYGNATPIEIGWDITGACSYPPFGGEQQDGDRFTFTASEGTLLRVDGRVRIFNYDEYATPRVKLKCGEDTTSLTPLADVWFRYPGDYPPMIVSLPRTGRYYLELQCPSGLPTPYELKVRAITPTFASVSRDMRDVVVASSSDGGQTWSGKTRVNDDPSGSDNALPELAVDDIGRVQVAWYDWRDDLGCGSSVRTYWAVSTNGGQSFAPNLRVSDLPSPWELSGPDQANIGDDVGLATSGNVTHVLWAQVVPNETVNVYAARIGDVTTGTDVAGLVATPEREGVRVSWQVLRPDRVTGYRLHRASDGGEFTPLRTSWTSIERAGEHVEQDASASPGHRYAYRLELQISDGTIAWEGPVELELDAVPARLAITRVGPNPFRDALRLRLAVPRSERVSAKVYDVTGTEVALIVEGTLSPGTHDLAWDARAARRAVPPGVYFLRAEMGSEQATMRIVRLD
jgi:hypothetical protein